MAAQYRVPCQIRIQKTENGFAGWPPLNQFPESTLSVSRIHSHWGLRIRFQFQVSSFQFPVPVSRFRGHDLVDLSHASTVFQISDSLGLGIQFCLLANPAHQYRIQFPDLGGAKFGWPACQYMFQIPGARFGGPRTPVQAGPDFRFQRLVRQTPCHYHIPDSTFREYRLCRRSDWNRGPIRPQRSPVTRIGLRDAQHTRFHGLARGRLQRGAAPFQDSSLQFQFRVSGLKWVRMARILQFTGLQITPKKLSCPLM